MAIIYSYPEIPDVQGGDLLLISDTGAPNKPTRSVDIDDLAAYIGTVVGVVQNLQSVLTVGNTYVSPDGHGTFTLNDITNNDGSITFVNADEGWSYFLNAEEGLFFTNGSGSQTGSTGIGIGYVSIGNSNYVGNINSINITADRTYTLPDASGTLALTSDIGGPYLPLTGGTLSGNLAIIKSQPTLTLVDGTKVSYLQNINGSLYYSAWLGDNIFQSNSGQTMVIKQNGNVGIGTTNPTNRLHVENGITKLDSKNFTSIPLGLYSSSTSTGMAIFADDPIANSGQINIDSTGSSGNNEVGMNFATGGFSSSNVKLSILNTGQLKAHSYGSGSFTGTATQRLAVDTNGNVIEIPIGSGPVDGSGTANYTARWIDTDTLGIGALYDNGTNIGIGTTNPTKKLHVNGEAFFQNTVSLPDNAYVGLGSSFDFHLSHNGSSSSITNSTGNLNISSNGGDAVFNTASTERLRITSSGNVGIGTTSPGSTLPADSETATKALQLTGVSGSAGDTAVLLRSSDNSSGLDLWHNASTGDSYIDNRYSSNQGDTIFRIKTAGTPLEALRITGDGNVGIGTTSPSEKLEVVGTIKSNQVDAFAENIPSRIGRSTGQHLSLYGNSTGNYLIGVGNKNTIIGRSGQGRIVFRNDGIQFSTEATQTRSDLFIEVINGYVGVGTSSPSQKLEVAGNILVRGSNDSADGLHLKDRTFVAFSDASSVVSRFRSSAAGIFQFQDGSYNTNIVLHTNGNSYLNGGNVGIGTTTPGAKLSVNGNVKIEGTNSLLFGGSATVPIWAISSNGSDLLIDDQASNIGSVLFNNNEGVALPRLTTTQINAISSPAQGLMAYNTTLNTICFYNGSSWQKVNHANM